MNNQVEKKFAKVSVVIPCYEASETITRAVDSIANQTLLPAEVILIDDASPDNGKTLQVIHALMLQYENVLNIQVIQLSTNQGVSSARNTGWEKATLPYIAFLDADDAWHPKKIEIQYAYMQNHPRVDLTSHSIQVLNNAEPFKIIDTSKLNLKPLSKLKFLCSNGIFPSSVMLRRNIPYRFKLGKHYSEDYLLWFMLVSEKYRLKNIAMPLSAAYKPLFGHSGLSGKLWLMEKGELDTFTQVYRAGYINLIQYAFCTIYSILKYLRRVVIVQLRSA